MANKNEIEIAKWLGIKMRDGLFFIPVMQGTVNARTEPSVQLILDYNLLHEAWVKFRDLKTSERDSDAHNQWKQTIGYSILNEPIGNSFDLLVKGIEWYNSLKKII